MELQLAQLKECEDHIRHAHATELMRTQEKLRREIEERESLQKQVTNDCVHNAYLVQSYMSVSNCWDS